MLLTAAAFAVGLMVGLGLFTFIYAQGASYLSTDPRACINCHIMNEQYDGWVNGVHSDVAGCSDCHLPHDNIVHKYFVKAENGLMHGLKFTTGWYPQNIEARQVSLDITNQACLHCHSELTSDIRHITARADGETFNCVRCHSGVGHR